MNFKIGNLVLACVASGALGATTLTWKGGADGYLGTAANWTPAQAPADGDTLKFPNTFGALTLTNNLTVTLGGISLASTGAFTLDGTEKLRLNGLVTSSATIAQNCSKYPQDAFNCPVELVGTTFFRLTGVPASTSNPDQRGCRNLYLNGYVGGSGDLVVTNENQRNVSVHLCCLTNGYTGKTCMRGKSGENYAGLVMYGPVTNGPCCLGVNPVFEIGGCLRFGKPNITIDRKMLITGAASFWGDYSGGVIHSNATITSELTSPPNLTFRSGSIRVDAFVSKIKVSRNDGGWITFSNPTNDIRNTSLAIMEGGFEANKLGRMGEPSSFGKTYEQFSIGKNNGGLTKSSLVYGGTVDTTIDAPIVLDSLGFTGTYGAEIWNTTKGTTLTVEGAIGCNNVSLLPHQRLHLRGAGNGVLKGNIAEGVHFVKEDAGTWTIESPTVATTGAVEVAAGTLVVNTDLPSIARLTAAAGTTLAGTGTITGPVTLAAGTTLCGSPTFAGAATLGADLTIVAGAEPITFNDTVSFPTRMTIDTSSIPEGTNLTVFAVTDPAKATGLASLICTLTDAEASASLQDGTLTIYKKGNYVWHGTESALWDTTTANWTMEDAATACAFKQDENAAFTDDATPADRRVISLDSAGVSALKVTVGGTNDYAFTGGALTAAGGLFKDGTGTLTISNTVSAPQGILVTNGTFNLSEDAVLGTTPIEITALGLHNLLTTNALAGPITIGKKGVVRTQVNVRTESLAVENAGPISLAPASSDVNNETELWFKMPGVVSNRTLQAVQGGGRVKFGYEKMWINNVQPAGDFTWASDIIFHNRPMVYFHGHSEKSAGAFVLGDLGRTVMTGETSLVSFRGGSRIRPIILNSHVDLTTDLFELNVSGYVKFMSPSNRWSCGYMNMNSGTAVLCTNDALDVRHGLQLGSPDKGTAEAPSYSTLDLNGFDQTLDYISDANARSGKSSAGESWTRAHPNPHSRQVVTSASAATLRLAGNTTGTDLLVPHTAITGAVTVEKTGSATLNLYQSNANTGSWLLKAGTTSVLASELQDAAYGGPDLGGTFGNSTNIVVDAGATLVLNSPYAAFGADARLSLEEGAHLTMTQDQTVDYLTLAGHPKKSGRYTAATNPEFITGSATLTVRTGDGGTLIIFR